MPNYCHKAFGATSFGAETPSGPDPLARFLKEPVVITKGAIIGNAGMNMLIGAAGSGLIVYLFMRGKVKDVQKEAERQGFMAENASKELSYFLDKENEAAARKRAKKPYNIHEAVDRRLAGSPLSDDEYRYGMKTSYFKKRRA